MNPKSSPIGLSINDSQDDVSGFGFPVETTGLDLEACNFVHLWRVSCGHARAAGRRQTEPPAGCSGLTAPAPLGPGGVLQVADSILQARRIL
jgi:hypothetical protein